MDKGLHNSIGHAFIPFFKITNNNYSAVRAVHACIKYIFVQFVEHFHYSDLMPYNMEDVTISSVINGID